MNKKPTPLFFSNLCKLIDGDEPEGTPEEQSMARKYYHDHYDDFEHFRLTDYSDCKVEE